MKLSNRQTAAVLAGSFFLAIGVGSGLKLWLGDNQQSQPAAIAPEVPESEASGAPDSGQSFSQPFLRAGSSLTLAEPVLLQSTSKEERVIAVTAGRSNPFAPITRPGPAARRSSKPAPEQPSAAPDEAQTVPTVPVVTTQPLPPLPAAPAAPPAANTTPLPTVAVAPSTPLPSAPGDTLPSLVPASPVDRVEISGVVQLGNRVRVIIREAGASTSRHVTVGDRLVGGQVRIKQVDLSGAEPLVVLEYNGQEFYRSVGSTALAGLS